MSFIDHYADWLGTKHPAVYKGIRPVWRALSSALSKKSYWERRKNYNYYAEVLNIVQSYSYSENSVIDVGSNETELLSKMDWFSRRVVLDIRYIIPREGIETIVCDFMEYIPQRKFDIVLCLQVLEHLRAPETFTSKLFDTGNTIIISIPYKWPAGDCITHVQDPVDDEKLYAWTKREPTETKLVKDGRERLIAVYDLLNN